MKNFLPALAVLALAGCAVATPAPVTPTPVEIAAENVALQGTGLDPPTYFAVGALLNAQACHVWFDGLAQRSNEYTTAQGVTGLASTALAGAGQPIPSVALGLASSALGALSNSTGIPYPVETGQLVEQALGTYLGAARMLPITTLAQAALLVDTEASLCSQRGAEWMAAQAVASAQTSVASSPVAAAQFRAFAATSAAPAPAAFVPPPRVLVNGR